MAFPTSPDTLSKTLERAQFLAGTVRTYALAKKAALASGNQSTSALLDIHTRCRTAWSEFGVYAAVPGIAAYAQSQLPVADAAAEFSAMRTAIANIVNWIEANFPKDASGYLLGQQFVSNVVTDRSFTPAQTAQLQALLQAVADTIGA